MVIVKNIIGFLKALVHASIRRFRPEELFFGATMIATVMSNYNSIVPDLFVMLLLAFYYLFFGWMILSAKEENHLIFSIVSGIAYSLCLVSMVIMEIEGKPYIYLFLLQALMLLGLFAYLKKKQWGIYKSNHYIRISIIIFLNLFIYCLKMK